MQCPIIRYRPSVKRTFFFFFFFLLLSTAFIEHFQSRGQKLYKFIEEKNVLYRKLKVQNLQDWFGTPTRPQWVANMAAVTSCESTLFARHFDLALETGLVSCRIALWDSFRK